MFKSILFATNLHENCRAALDVSIKLASTNGATLYLLFVLGKDVPSDINAHLRSIFGESAIEDLLLEHEQSAYKSLIGKLTSKNIGKRAISLYMKNAEYTEDQIDFPHKEIVAQGESTPETIVDQANKNHCDLIVLGSQKAFRSGYSVGSVTKGVLRTSPIPVIVIPPYPSGVGVS